MRIRLTERCHMMGRIHVAGEIVELPDGTKGPHKTVRTSVDRIDYGTTQAVDANRLLGEMEDVPLYEILPDEGAAS